MLLCQPAFVFAGADAAFDIDAATESWLATIGPEAMARSDSYFEGSCWLQYAGTALTAGIALMTMMFGWAEGVRCWLERKAKYYFLVAMGMGMFYLTLSNVMAFPFTWYVYFVREHQFGLATQTFSQWFGEQLIACGLQLACVSLVIAVLYLIVRATKGTWWIWCAGMTIVFLIIAITAFPVFVAPLFNTYKPMVDGPLRQDILLMAQANGVPADDVYVFDVSRQSNRITANVSGVFGTTRISLSDTLIARASPEAVRHVMAHEIGHYTLHHEVSDLTMTGVMVALVFALVHWSFQAITRNERWGVCSIADPAGLPLVAALVFLFSALATPITNNIMRYHELQADHFGLNVSRAPAGAAEAAVLVSEYRKMCPTPLEEWLFHHHPSGYTRIRMAMQWQAYEIAAGRMPDSTGGPPPGWQPDFVVLNERVTAPNKAVKASGGSGRF
jgi:STE24 endopeptidase